MKMIYSLFLLSTVAIAGPVKKSDLQQNIDEPVVPGTQVPVERMNTAPTSPEISPEDKEHRNTLKAREQKQEELIEESKKSVPQRGRDPMGPSTMGQPAYPSSGPLRNRSTDMTGDDMSNATLMGSDVDPRVPSRNPKMRKKQSQEESMKVGPYDDGEYQFDKNKMKIKDQE